MAWHGNGGDPTAAPVMPAPEPLVFDPNAPVSGHQVPPEPAQPHSETAEHDWAAASARVFPALRPAGTQGTMLEDLDEAALATEALKRHALPVLDRGPVDLRIAYVLREPSYDVLLNADHLLEWGITPDVVRQTAMANLARWSSGASWTEEAAGGRRLLTSDTGDGGDAARILLPEVLGHLTAELGAEARVLIGLPDRDLLIAGSFRPDDPQFGPLFCGFVAELSADAEQLIDQRVFEVVDGELVLYAG